MENLRKSVDRMLDALSEEQLRLVFVVVNEFQKGNVADRCPIIESVPSVALP